MKQNAVDVFVKIHFISTVFSLRRWTIVLFLFLFFFFTALLHSAIFFPVKLDYLRKITIWYLYFPMMWPSTRRLSTAMWLNTYNVLTENKNKAKKICTWLLAKTFNWDTSRTRLPKRRRLSSSFFTVAQTLCKVFSVVSVTLLFCSVALRIWYCNIILRNRRLSPDF